MTEYIIWNQLIITCHATKWAWQQLKRAGARTDWRLTLFSSHNNTSNHGVCLPSLAVWHPRLTTAQAKTLETLQKRAMNIIFPGMDYRLSLIMAMSTRWRTDGKRWLIMAVSTRWRTDGKRWLNAFSKGASYRRLLSSLPTARQNRFWHCK